MSNLGYFITKYCVTLYCYDSEIYGSGFGDLGMCLGWENKKYVPHFDGETSRKVSTCYDCERDWRIKLRWKKMCWKDGKWMELAQNCVQRLGGGGCWTSWFCYHIVNYLPTPFRLKIFISPSSRSQRIIFLIDYRYFPLFTRKVRTTFYFGCSVY